MGESQARSEKVHGFRGAHDKLLAVGFFKQRTSAYHEDFGSVGVHK